MNNVGVFPFGQPILPLTQKDRTRKSVFVLGVYASAVHARWVGEDSRQKIGALAVASEPEIFWRGSISAAKEIIDAIKVPAGAGRLLPASKQLNGPSGKALDELFLAPLGLSRGAAWLRDLVPHSCMNSRQEFALKREYDPVQKTLGLPAYDWPRLPDDLADMGRRSEIEVELMESGTDLVVTLGDQPLKWFTAHYGTAVHLGAYPPRRVEESPDRPDGHSRPVPPFSRYSGTTSCTLPSSIANNPAAISPDTIQHLFICVSHFAQLVSFRHLTPAPPSSLRTVRGHCSHF